MGAFLGGLAIILFLVYFFKWMPESNKNKIGNFIHLVDRLNGSFTKDDVINTLPFKPLSNNFDTLIYFINKTTGNSLGGHTAYSETTTIHLEMKFVNNKLYSIYRILPDGKKLLYKQF